MSVSYLSKELDNTDVTPVNECIQFAKPDKKTVNKSVAIRLVENRLIVTFYGYEEQKEVNAILKAFKIMLNTKFRAESD